uniref:rRNA N-glycosidase n=1 Tax=Oryza punctata TaxID=4537 RepID=A0A0E0LQY5_ORYPU
MAQLIALSHVEIIASCSNILYLNSTSKWYRLKDHKEKLPPRSQLPYSEKPHEGIYVLTNTTRYGSIGGSSVVLGPRAWDHYHGTFLKADELVRQSNKKPLTSGDSPALAVPVVGISEPLRFPQLQKWILDNCTAASSSGVMVPYEYTKHFTNWGDLSTAIFSGKLSEKLKAYTLE